MSEQGNVLAPAPSGAPAPQPQAGTMPEAHSQLETSVQQAHSGAAAKVSKLKEALAQADNIRGELAGLSAMGDNVTAEDVIKGAGNLVGKGGDPMAMASLLADMPQGGQALSTWLGQHTQQLGANEQQIKQQLALAQHDAGSAALHVIAMHHIGEQFKAAQGQQAPPVGNDLEGAPNASN